MSLDPDLIVDRRRLRRQVSTWRILGIMAAIVAVISGGALVATRTGAVDLPGAQHVARVAISGFITYDRPLIRTLDAVAENTRVRALVLQIDSPGGSTAGSEALYAAVRRVAARKPVVAVVGTVGASGAYIAALGADRIVAAETSLVGSVGVIVQWAEFDQLLRTLGIRFQQIKTTPLKAAPNGFEPATEEARAALRAVIGDTYTWFQGLVSTRRNIQGEQLATVADGRVFTGRQSLELRLIDQMGDERAARGWLQEAHQIPTNMRVVEYRPQRQNVPSFLGLTAHYMADAIGIPSNWLPPLHEPEARLDGLVSLWHPAINPGR